MNLPTKVALGSNVHRMYGLNSDAWRHTTSGTMEEQQSKIKDAICKALSEDAGGCGTVGFHRNKAENVRQLPNYSNDNTIIYRANLIPCDPETGNPLNSTQVATNARHHNDDNVTTTNGVEFSGNDSSYISINASPFQIQIVVSRSEEGVSLSKLHDALFLKGKEATEDGKATMEGCIGGVSLKELMHTDDIVKTLNDKVTNVRLESPNDKSKGFYIEVMLLEPTIQTDDAVTCPPAELNKVLPTYKPFSVTQTDDSDDSSIFQSAYTSRQFTTEIGPWEQENIKAFQLMALDIQKALVRIEFPEFDEGCKDKTFREIYQLNTKLKSGSFATVCKGTHRATGRRVAVKCVLRENLPPNADAAVYDEVLVLSTLQHPLICPLIDFFEERNCYFLVIELMSGGDLFDRIGTKKNYNEKDAQTLCKKMIESICFCHENSVVHRDLKPKNLLLIDQDDDCAIKLADFGFATRVYEPNSLTKQCGTPFFIAPEILLQQKYDQRADMWSVGVIVYLLLAGDLPFVGRSQKELFQNIVRGEFSFPEESWANVSNDAKYLLRKLLVTDPSKRFTSSEAMRSSWMVEPADKLKRISLLSTSQRLATFNARMKLRAAMIAVSAMTSIRMSVSKDIGDIVPLEIDSSDEEENIIDKETADDDTKGDSCGNK